MLHTHSSMVCVGLGWAGRLVAGYYYYYARYIHGKKNVANNRMGKTIRSEKFKTLTHTPTHQYTKCWVRWALQNANSEFRIAFDGLSTCCRFQCSLDSRNGLAELTPKHRPATLLHSKAAAAAKQRQLQ